MDLIKKKCKLNTTFNGKEYYKYSSKNIVISDNKNFFFKKCYISITTNKIIYLYWDIGRIYFKKNNSIIQNTQFEDNMLLFSFIYKGKWEDETNEFKIVDVNKKICIYFNSFYDYKLFKHIFNFI